MDSSRSWNWDSLRAVVQEVIDEDRIGQPAALRLTFHGRGTEADTLRSLRKAESVATAWFAGQPVSTHSIGGPEKTIVTALTWASGQSAILSVSSGAAGPTGGNVMLMGSRGSVYHELRDSESWAG